MEINSEISSPKITIKLNVREAIALINDIDAQSKDDMYYFEKTYPVGDNSVLATIYDHIFAKLVDINRSFPVKFYDNNTQVSFNKITD